MIRRIRSDIAAHAADQATLGTKACGPGRLAAGLPARIISSACWTAQAAEPGARPEEHGGQRAGLRSASTRWQRTDARPSALSSRLIGAVQSVLALGASALQIGMICCRLGSWQQQSPTLAPATLTRPGAGSKTRKGSPGCGRHRTDLGPYMRVRQSLCVIECLSWQALWALFRGTGDPFHGRRSTSSRFRRCAARDSNPEPAD
jgi:hypothetical protein